MDLDADRWGADWADDYDELLPIPAQQTADAIDYLYRNACGGTVLEIAAGTGRLAIPLADRGLSVTATDASDQMLARLRAKDRDARVTTRVEAMPVVTGGPFALIFCVYSSLTCLSTQDAQLELVRAAAQNLAPGGRLVLETLLIDPRAFVETKPLAMTADGMIARFGRYDVVTQILDQYYLVARRDRPVSTRPDTGRMVTPAELDLMAKLAGLRLRERLGDWAGAPFVRPGNVVSTYERDG